MESPIGRVEGLAEAVREGKPLPPADLAVLEHSGAVAEDAGGWDGVAEIVVAAELVDRGFRMHRLADGADCRRDELLLGDYSLVCAAELATRMGRSDVDREFAEAAMTAAAGEDYVPLLERAVTMAAPPASGEVVPEGAPPPAGVAGDELAPMDAYLAGVVARDPATGRAPT